MIYLKSTTRDVLVKGQIAVAKIYERSEVIALTKERLREFWLLDHHTYNADIDHTEWKDDHCVSFEPHFPATSRDLPILLKSNCNNFSRIFHVEECDLEKVIPAQSFEQYEEATDRNVNEWLSFRH
ncbi:hypothetical protein RB195_001466 [Necator americanus]|uniref:Uncharacterized protein n=1 Tax=Necator americanus TaxID=51031 RepID=A0ABR1DEF5_NECAM